MMLLANVLALIPCPFSHKGRRGKAKFWKSLSRCLGEGFKSCPVLKKASKIKALNLRPNKGQGDGYRNLLHGIVRDSGQLLQGAYRKQGEETCGGRGASERQ